MNYERHTISVATVLGDDDEQDNRFLEYLDEYSIDYKITEKSQDGYPVVEYTGGPIALTNMLMERFGLEEHDIRETYPELYGE
jgi:hypothetical protein